MKIRTSCLNNQRFFDNFDHIFHPYGVVLVCTTLVTERANGSNN